MDIALATLVVSILWIASEVTLVRMKHSGGGDATRDKSTLRLLWRGIAIGVIGGILLSHQPYGALPLPTAPVQITGLFLILAGLAIRWIAILSLKQFFTVDVAIGKDHTIVKSGLYAVIRHPAYAGTLLSFLGLGIFFMNILSLLVLVVPITAAFLRRMDVEEGVLLEAFGDEYRTYMASTRRIIPWVY
jgi:protein-S-isoprenylcysteine O-methyltransferase Ste14